ncbi:RNA-directed DNA polymerase, eukaryota [Tanacetum coccineum]
MVKENSSNSVTSKAHLSNNKPTINNDISEPVTLNMDSSMDKTNQQLPRRKIPESPWGSPIPIGDGYGDVNRFPDGDGDEDGDEAEKRGWGWGCDFSSNATEELKIEIGRKLGIQFDDGMDVVSNGKGESCREERLGSTFVESDANAFNAFINMGRLHDFALGEDPMDFGPKCFKLFNHRMEDDGFNKPDLFEKNRSKKKDIQSRLDEWDAKAEAGILTSLDCLKREEDPMVLNRLEQNEDSLKQKNRVKWAIEGDENTNFFHSIVNKKGRRNQINGLNINGNWVENPNAIYSEAINHFSNRFHDPQPNYEVKEAVWNCCGSKSPGPDGLNFKFIIRYRDIIKIEFFKFIKYFKKYGCLARGCNASFIVLIPKTLDPLDLGDYRPISLIGCMYKVLSKLPASRLSKVIHKLISPNQSAFLVASLCRAIHLRVNTNDVSAPPFTWNSWVPRKVIVCAWRVALDRLPTRLNLCKRGINPPTSFAYRPKDKPSKAKEDAKNKASTSNEASTSNGGNMASTSNHFDVLSKPDVNTNHIVEEGVASKVVDLGHSSEKVNEDNDSDVEEVYNKSAIFLLVACSKRELS